MVCFVGQVYGVGAVNLQEVQRSVKDGYFQCVDTKRKPSVALLEGKLRQEVQTPPEFCLLSVL